MIATFLIKTETQEKSELKKNMFLKMKKISEEIRETVQVDFVFRK